jgi:7-keto-8-aminopelargonate synthetase-like enzyme
MHEIFRQRLSQWVEQGRLRRLRDEGSLDSRRAQRDGRELVNFGSNSYLGLERHPAVTAAAAAAAESTSSTSSRLICGGSPLLSRLEEETAAWKGSEACLVLNSGFQANITLLPALAGRHDRILADRLAHASLIDGAKLSGAELLRFPHNDLDALQELLQKPATGQVFVVSETVFSMDGDMPDLPRLAALCRSYGAFLYLDDAHGAGICGPEGSGPAHGLGADLLLGTYSKVNSCRGLIYSTALPPAVPAASLAALSIVRSEEGQALRHRLLALGNELRRLLRDGGLDIRHDPTPIVPVPCGDEAATLRLAAALAEEGFLCPAIRPPTVPEGSCRLRLSLTAAHLDRDIRELAAAILRHHPGLRIQNSKFKIQENTSKIQE